MNTKKNKNKWITIPRLRLMLWRVLLGMGLYLTHQTRPKIACSGVIGWHSVNDTCKIWIMWKSFLQDWIENAFCTLRKKIVTKSPLKRPNTLSKTSSLVFHNPPIKPPFWLTLIFKFTLEWDCVLSVPKIQSNTKCLIFRTCTYILSFLYWMVLLIFPVYLKKLKPITWRLWR